MNKILPISLVVFSVFFFSGCSKKSAEVGVLYQQTIPTPASPFLTMLPPKTPTIFQILLAQTPLPLALSPKTVPLLAQK